MRIGSQLAPAILYLQVGDIDYFQSPSRGYTFCQGGRKITINAGRLKDMLARSNFSKSRLLQPMVLAPQNGLYYRLVIKIAGIACV